MERERELTPKFPTASNKRHSKMCFTNYKERFLFSIDTQNLKEIAILSMLVVNLCVKSMTKLN